MASVEAAEAATVAAGLMSPRVQNMVRNKSKVVGKRIQRNQDRSSEDPLSPRGRSSEEQSTSKSFTSPGPTSPHLNQSTEPIAMPPSSRQNMNTNTRWAAVRPSRNPKKEDATAHTDEGDSGSDSSSSSSEDSDNTASATTTLAVPAASKVKMINGQPVTLPLGNRAPSKFQTARAGSGRLAAQSSRDTTNDGSSETVNTTNTTPITTSQSVPKLRKVKSNGRGENEAGEGDDMKAPRSPRKTLQKKKSHRSSKQRLREKSELKGDEDERESEEEAHISPSESSSTRGLKLSARTSPKADDSILPKEDEDEDEHSKTSAKSHSKRKSGGSSKHSLSSRSHSSKDTHDKETQ